MFKWLKDWFGPERQLDEPDTLSSQDLTVISQAEAFVAACATGQVKAFIIVAEVEDGNENPNRICTMGACNPIWGRTALSIAIADFPITTH